MNKTLAVVLALGLSVLAYNLVGSSSNKYKTPACFLHESGMAVVTLVDTAKGSYIGELKMPMGGGLLYGPFEMIERDLEAQNFNQINCQTGKPIGQEEGLDVETGVTGPSGDSVSE